MSLRTPFPIFKSSSDSRVALLQGLMIAALVIGALYVGRDVLLPLVVAILLSFVLTPPLIFLRKFKVPRVLGVFIVVTCRLLHHPRAVLGAVAAGDAARPEPAPLPARAFGENHGVA